MEEKGRISAVYIYIYDLALLYFRGGVIPYASMECDTSSIFSTFVKLGDTNYIYIVLFHAGFRSFRPMRPLIQSVCSLTAAEVTSSPEEVLCKMELLPDMLQPVKTELPAPVTTELLPAVGSSVSTTAATTVITTVSSPVATVEASSTTSILSLPKLLNSEKATKCQACEDRHKRKVGDDLEQSCLSLSSVIAKLVENSPTRKSLDEDDLFGELVTAELKKMKSGEKETVKMELSKILYCRRNSQQ